MAKEKPGLPENHVWNPGLGMGVFGKMGRFTTSLELLFITYFIGQT